MKKKAIKLFVLLLLCSFTFLNCNAQDPPIKPNLDPDPHRLTFSEVINAGGSLTAPLKSEKVDTIDVDRNLPIGEATFDCSTISHEGNAAGGGDEGFPLFNPTSDVIFPGSMLQGNSLQKATPNPIVIKRAGGTVSTNVLNGNTVSSFEVDEVKKSSITQAMNNILASSSGDLPANFSVRVESIQSEEEFALKLGVDVDHAFGSLKSKIGYNYDASKSSFLVTLNQEFYTMSFDLPTSLDELFAPSATAEQLSKYVGPNNPATYISSVTYGRIFYMLFESSSTQHDLGVAIDGVFKGATVDVTGNLDLNYFNSIENVTYNLFAYGGDAATAFEALGETDLEALKDILKRSTTLQSAKPLSYVVRNVADNQIVSTQLATSYEVVECEQVGSVGTLPSIVHWSNSPILEALGPITAAYANGPEHFVLINEQGDWVRSTVQANGEGLLEGPFPWGADLVFNTVGAAYRIAGPGSDLIVFNGKGNRFASYKSGGIWSEIKSLANYNAYGCPFINTGIGAATYIGSIEMKIALPSSPSGPSHFDFDLSGESYTQAGTLAGINNKGMAYYFLPPNKVQKGFGLGGKIDKVGAAIGYDNGGLTGNTRVHILFDQSGTQYVVWGDFGNGTEVIGPFGL